MNAIITETKAYKTVPNIEAEVIIVKNDDKIGFKTNNLIFNGRAADILPVLENLSVAVVAKIIPDVEKENRELMLDQFFTRMHAHWDGEEEVPICLEGDAVGHAMKVAATIDSHNPKNDALNVTSDISVTTEDPVIIMSLLEQIQIAVINKLMKTFNWDETGVSKPFTDNFLSRLQNDLYYFISDKYKADHFNPEQYLFGLKSQRDNYNLDLNVSKI